MDPAREDSNERAGHFFLRDVILGKHEERELGRLVHLREHDVREHRRAFS
jgi:hypothetical protein